MFELMSSETIAGLVLQGFSLQLAQTGLNQLRPAQAGVPSRDSGKTTETLMHNYIKAETCGNASFNPGEMIAFMRGMQMSYIMHKNGNMREDLLNMTHKRIYK